jgi:hypothetical protein
MVYHFDYAQTILQAGNGFLYKILFRVGQLKYPTKYFIRL